MKTDITLYLLLSLAVLGISGCGGGGDGGSDSIAGDGGLIAHAGFDQTIRSGSQVILSGKNSQKVNSITTRTWRAITDLKGGKLVAQKNRGAAKFIAPKVTSIETFKFGYRLTDSKGNVSTDDMEITVVPGDDPDKFLNQNFRSSERIRVVVGSESVVALTQPTEFKVSLDLVASYNGQNNIVDEVHQEIDAKWFDSTGGNVSDSPLNPTIWFDLPQLYLSNLAEIIDQTVIPDEVDATLRVSSADVGSISPFLYIYAEDELISSGLAPLDIEYDVVRRMLGSDSRDRAQQYYSSIDPDKKKLTLCHWKHENGITPDLERQAFSNGTVEVADGRIIHQKYINGYDLGFGRDMYVYQKDSGELSAWVVNYPFIDAMENRTNAIATVVMEYAPLNGVGASFTRFYTYIESLDRTLSEDYLVDNHQIPTDDHCFNTDGTPKDDKGLNPADFRRKLSYGLDFDGRGYKYMPEACTVCHGGIGLDQNIAANGDVEANFLPWDVHNLFFDDRNFEQRPNSQVDGELRELILENSEDTYRELNEAVLQTRTLGGADPIRELIHGWYGSSDTTVNTLPDTATFNSDYVPDGWQQNPDMYKKVVGPMCRTCHIARTDASGLAFTSEDQFSLYVNQNNRSLLEDRRVMPLARLTMDNFWGELDIADNSNGLQVLSDYLGGNLKKSVKPVATILPSNGLTATVGDSLRFDAFASVHYQTLSWSVSPNTGVSLTPTSDPQISFSSSVSGEYTLALTLQNGDQTSTRTVTLTVEEPIPATAEFTSPELNFGEGDGRISLTIRRTGNLSGDLRMHFKIRATSTAIYGVDFLPLDGDDDILIREGASEATQSFDLVDDADVEGTEDFHIELYRGFDGAEGVSAELLSTAHVTIVDNDELVVIDNPPVASAGNDMEISLDGEQTSFSIPLDASGSTDDNAGLSYSWAVSSTASNHSFFSAARNVSYVESISQSTEQTVTYFRLTVEDSKGQRSSDDMKVTATRVYDPADGRALFFDNCSACHKTNTSAADSGSGVGGAPELNSLIGSTSACSRVSSFASFDTGGGLMEAVNPSALDLKNISAYFGC